MTELNYTLKFKDEIQADIKKLVTQEAVFYINNIINKRITHFKSLRTGKVNRYLDITPDWIENKINIVETSGYDRFLILMDILYTRKYRIVKIRDTSVGTIRVYFKHLSDSLYYLSLIDMAGSMKLEGSVKAYSHKELVLRVDFSGNTPSIKDNSLIAILRLHGFKGATS